MTSAAELRGIAAPAGRARTAAAAVLAALIVAGIYSFPLFAFYREFPADYFPRFGFDEEYYALLAAATAAGRAPQANPFLDYAPPEGGRGPEAMNVITRSAAAVFVRELGVGRGFAAITLLSSLLTPLLMFAFVHRLTRSVAWSFAAAVAAPLLPHFLYPLTVAARAGLGALLPGAGFPAEPPQTLVYARRYNPALSAVFFYAWLLLGLQALRSRRILVAVLAGAAGGALFYSYFFFGAFALILGGLWAAVCLLFEKEQLRAALASLAAQMAAAAPFAWWTLENAAQHLATSSEASHRPYLPWPHILGMCVAIALLFAARRGERRAEQSWLAAVGVAPMILMNQQVLTGVRAEPQHVVYLLPPLATLILCVALGRAPFLSLAARWAPAALVLCALAFSVPTQMRKAERVKLEGNAAAHHALFAEVRRSTGPEDVLLADDADAFSTMLALYSGRQVFSAQLMGYFPWPDRGELRRRALCQFWLLGLGVREFEERIIPQRASVLYNPEGSTYWFNPHLLTAEVRAARRSEFERAIARPASCCRADYRLDWLVETPGFEFDAARVSELFEVKQEIEGRNFRLIRVARRAAAREPDSRAAASGAADFARQELSK
jgi:hypothetical protein